MKPIQKDFPYQRTFDRISKENSPYSKLKARSGQSGDEGTPEARNLHDIKRELQTLDEK
ncbi:hypothetical protein JF544_18800 [Halobacillus kuroshimensis]|uniref:Uncharacterized protein n=1 Tax=Halobacillus kuroshimensis TaxID=302481 RepID=A0ABS3E139_9BACI|nr:hypothetical protein [Halobacillus kuroshimensis]MBN8237297.1 hypothetical protein [Halobacillus kuroshimensis]